MSHSETVFYLLLCKVKKNRIKEILKMIKQVTVRLNKENYVFITKIKETSNIENFSLNQIINSIITEKRIERNLDNSGIKNNLLKGVL